MNALTVLTSEIRQFDGLYSLNDLTKAAIVSGVKKDIRPNEWLSLGQTKGLSEILITENPSTKPIVTKPGRYGGTYVCRELVYAYAMWISPKFHLHVIQAFDAIQGGSHTQGGLFGRPGQRYLVSFAEDGNSYHAKAIDPGCVVMTPRRFLQAIVEPGGSLFSNNDTGLLFDVIERLNGVIRRQYGLSAATRSITDASEVSNDVLRIIRKAGKNGMTEREIRGYSRKFRAMSRNEQNRVLETLQISGDISRVNYSPLSGRGKPRLAWVSASGQ